MVTLALRPTTELLRTLATAEPHPPLYPLLLKAWMRLAGTGELAVRMPSVWAGTALVPVLAALGRTVGMRAAVTAALLTAFSPFLLWYATEARMYPLAVLFGAAAFYWLARLLRRPSRASALGYTAAAALGLLTHYFVLYLAATQALVGGIALARDRRLARPLAVAGAVAALPVVAWMAVAGHIVGSYYGAQPGSVDLLGVLARTLERIPAGWSVQPTTAVWVGVAAAPFVASGAWLARRRAPTWIAWLALPTLLAMAVSLARPMYQERYLAVVAPPYLLFAATAIALVPRPGRLFLLAGAVGTATVPLWNMAMGGYVRSQYGSHTAEINALGRAGEAVILTGTSQFPLYSYYASRGGIGLPVFGLPRDPPATEAQVGPELAAIAERFDGLWLMLYAEHDYDPGDVVERWLTVHAYRAPPRWTVNGRLIRFVTERSANLGPVSPPRTIAPGFSLAVALPTGSVPAGGLVPVRLDLTRDAASNAPPKLRLRLVDGAGFLWGEADEVLGSGFGLSASSAWTERRALPVLSGAPEGTYRVEAQLYVEDPAGAKPLGRLDLGTVAVAASARFWPGQIPGFRSIEEQAAGWNLLGWAGADTGSAGARAYLTTVWRAEGSPAPVEQVLRIVGSDGAVASTRATALDKVRPGDVRRVQISPPVGAHWRPGTYRYELGLRDTSGAPIPWSSGAAWLALGTLRVSAGPPVATPAAPASPLDVRFGEGIRLRGYTWSRAPAALTLQWESLHDTDTSFAVFVHLLDSTGTIVAQSDGPPSAGRQPTDGWAPGDVVDDRRELSAPPGRYRVEVGLYDPRTGTRLPATEAGRALGDAVNLGVVQVGS
ncbi:MAG TPA: glycosyltransferase family 39 protein [Chloroflexota bacterium]|nr:glycosyltransferase family 39 protein [Chloroflexota bacterium]